MGRARCACARVCERERERVLCVRMRLPGGQCCAAMTLRTAVWSHAHTQPHKRTHVCSRVCAQGDALRATMACLSRPARTHSHTNALAHVLVYTYYYVCVRAGQGDALRATMASLSRPTRIVRGKDVDPSWSVDPAKFELPEEVRE